MEVLHNCIYIFFWYIKVKQFFLKWKQKCRCSYFIVSDYNKTFTLFYFYFNFDIIQGHFFCALFYNYAPRTFLLQPDHFHVRVLIRCILSPPASPESTSNLCRDPCLLYSCFVFFFWTFDFEHCSLSEQFFYIKKFIKRADLYLIS